MFSLGSGSTKRGKEIFPGMYYFGETGMLDCNQYAIHDSETDEVAIFDAGNNRNLDGLFKGLEMIGLDHNNITKVYITHEHVDHVLGLYPMVKKLSSEPPQIFAFGETAKILKTADIGQMFPGNLGIRPEHFGVNITPLDVHELELKELVQFSDFSFELLKTPGHSIGSICYYEPSKKILIPGDLVFAGGSFGRYDFPGGSLKQLQESIGRVNELDVNWLLPGHMNYTDNGNQQINLSYRMVKSIGSYY